jgi:hypothetical protein
LVGAFLVGSLVLRSAIETNLEQERKRGEMDRTKELDRREKTDRG